jgi:hypothetical protein
MPATGLRFRQSSLSRAIPIYGFSSIKGFDAMTKPKMMRRDAIAELAKHGIKGAQIYLIDLIPLIEMMWADGRIQHG